MPRWCRWWDIKSFLNFNQIVYSLICWLNWSCNNTWYLSISTNNWCFGATFSQTLIHSFTFHRQSLSQCLWTHSQSLIQCLWIHSQSLSQCLWNSHSQSRHSLTKSQSGVPWPSVSPWIPSCSPCWRQGSRLESCFIQGHTRKGKDSR